MTTENKTTQPAVDQLRKRFDLLRREGLRDVKFWYVGSTGSDSVSVDDLCAEVNGLLDCVRNEQFIDITAKIK